MAELIIRIWVRIFGRRATRGEIRAATIKGRAMFRSGP